MGQTSVVGSEGSWTTFSLHLARQAYVAEFRPLSAATVLHAAAERKGALALGGTMASVARLYEPTSHSLTLAVPFLLKWRRGDGFIPCGLGGPATLRWKAAAAIGDGDGMTADRYSSLIALVQTAVGQGRAYETQGDLVTAATCHWIGAELAVLAGMPVGSVREHFESAIRLTERHLENQKRMSSTTPLHESGLKRMEEQAICATAQRLGRLQERQGDALFDGGGESEVKATTAAYYAARYTLVFAGTKDVPLKQRAAIQDEIARIDAKLAVVAPPRS